MSIIIIDRYTALEIKDQGQNGFSLIQGYVDKAGEFKPSFCKRECGRDKVEKVTPLSVKLGMNAATAIGTLTQLLNEIGGQGEDNIPF